MKKTHLYDEHIKLGAQMVEFAGWQMPVRYGSIIEEHQHTRAEVSLFDTCHMGQVELRGPQALAALQKLTVSDMASLAVGRCRYTMFCDEEGGIVDDLVVYRLGEEGFLLVVNAGPADGDCAWMRDKLAGMELELDRLDARQGKIDLQGRRSREFLAALTGEGRFESETALAELKWYHFTRCKLLGAEMLISRTGYTGEMGFELYPAAADAGALWSGLLAGAEGFSVRPAGLGARDSLRLEMGYPLYGHEHSRATNPFDAGFGGRVSFEKGEFIGRQKLLARKQAGPRLELAGFVFKERGIPRAGADIYLGERHAGRLSSGGFAPSLGYPVALAFLELPLAGEGAYSVELRGKRLKAERVELPFYKQGSVRG